MNFPRRLFRWQRLNHHPAVLREQLEGRRRLEQSRGLALASGIGAPRLLSTAADGNSSGFFSWVDKVKSVFKGKTSESAAQQSPEQGYTLSACADDMKRSRPQLKLHPHVNEAAATRALEKQEAILRALASHDPTGQHLDVKQKAEVAVQCNSTIQDVNKLLAKYEWMKEAYLKILQRKDEGKEPPKTLEELEELMGGPFKPDASQNLGESGDTGRNSPCHCGSGKKYKRCCGRA